MDQKLKVLAWSDCVFAPTGFGTVSRHVLAALHGTGKYQIHQVAINYHGDFYDTNVFPYQLSPAKLLDPSDAQGRRQFLRAVRVGDYDLLWILNDLHLVHGIVGELRKIQAEKRQSGRKLFKIIYYYPVDCTVTREVRDMLFFADALVTYTQWGRLETLKKVPELSKPVQVIGHGCDVEHFKPLDCEVRQSLRAAHFRLTDPDTYIIININQNLARKDLPRTLLAFSEFRKRVPKSVLYLHCLPTDHDIELIQCCRYLGLSSPGDVLFPNRSSVAGTGLPMTELNKVYNCADAYLTTTLGEGWGLTITDAMCCAIPVITPNNSSIPEILGHDGDRGYVYECKELVWADNAGYRPMGRIEDIVAKMHECYLQRATVLQEQILARALEYVQAHQWHQIGHQWTALFEHVVCGNALLRKTGEDFQNFPVAEPG